MRNITRFVGKENKTRLVVTCSQKINFNLFRVTESYIADTGPEQTLKYCSAEEKSACFHSCLTAQHDKRQTVKIEKTKITSSD